MPLSLTACLWATGRESSKMDQSQDLNQTPRCPALFIARATSTNKTIQGSACLMLEYINWPLIVRDMILFYPCLCQMPILWIIILAAEGTYSWLAAGDPLAFSQISRVVFAQPAILWPCATTAGGGVRAGYPVLCAADARAQPLSVSLLALPVSIAGRPRIWVPVHKGKSTELHQENSTGGFQTETQFTRPHPHIFSCPVPPQHPHHPPEISTRCTLHRPAAVEAAKARRCWYYINKMKMGCRCPPPSAHIATSDQTGERDQHMMLGKRE